MQKRRYLVFMLALTAMLTLVGCGKKEETAVIITPDGTVEMTEEMLAELMGLAEQIEEEAEEDHTGHNHAAGEECADEEVSAEVVGNIPTLNEMQFAIEEAGMVSDPYMISQAKSDTISTLNYGGPGATDMRILDVEYNANDTVMSISERVDRWKNFYIPAEEPNINKATHYCLESAEDEFKNGCNYHTLVLVNHDRYCNPVEQTEGCYAYRIYQFITKGTSYITLFYDADENYEPIDENMNKFYQVLDDLQYTVPDEAK